MSFRHGFSGLYIAARGRSPVYTRGATQGGGMKRTVLLLLLSGLIFGTVSAWCQKPDTPARAVRANFIDVDRRILAMAKDWPSDKYDYKLKPELRTFGRCAGAYSVR